MRERNEVPGVLRPEATDQVHDVVKWVAAEGTPVEVVGTGTKRGLGRPTDTGAMVDLSRLSGILLYEPEELVVSALPGTPIAELEAVLAEKGQHLAFEPPDFSALLADPKAANGARPRGGTRGGTLGGVVACNLSGPRRLHAGAVRDHVLGLSGVSGRGDAYKTGGRVFKNVTGYDLSKLMTGSYGTLSVLTQITLKAPPRPDTTRTVCLLGLSVSDGVAALTAALQTPFEVSGAAYLPPVAAARSAVGAIAGAAVTAIRLEGIAASVAYRSEQVRARLKDAGAAGMTELDDPESRTLWQEIRDVAPLLPADGVVWRLSLAPAAAPTVITALAELPVAAHVVDWGGGLVWLALTADAGSLGEDAGAASVRAAVAESGDGHATLVRASAPVRARVPVFQPQEPALAALTARVKDSFDPRRVLNPGRLFPEL